MTLRGMIALSLLCVALSVLAISAVAAPVQGQDRLHVSPKGRADGDGTAARPAATLSRALELSRSKGVRRIVVEQGTYYDTSVTLDARDNGLTIEGEEGKPPLLLGGVAIGGWKREGPLLVADLPASAGGAGGDALVRLLIVNGQMALRARIPQKGYLTNESSFPVRWLSTTAGGWERKPTDDELLTMKFRPQDVPAGLSVKNAEVTVYHKWDESCVPVASIDRASNTMRFAGKLEHPAGAFDVHRYAIWNTAEGLTGAGQFYHDRERNRLVYRPRAGESAGTLKAVVGTRNSIIELKGSENEPVKNITLRDLELQATTAPAMAGGFGALRYPGAVQLGNAAEVQIQRLKVKNVAGQGIDSGWRPAKQVEIDSCEVSSCGAGGIAVGGEKVTIRNNDVHEVGLLFPSGIGIARGGTDCLVEQNEVHDCTYSGISYGGTRNMIRRNLVYRCMTQLDDGAAIYLGGGKQCVIQDNVCRDITGPAGAPHVGYYLDEGCDGTLVRRNVAINADMAMLNHMARNCRFEDNVMVNDKDLEIVVAHSEGVMMRRNVAYAGGKLEIRGVNGIRTWSQNILFSKSGKVEFVQIRENAAAVRTTEPPEDTLVEDPKFVSVSKKDLHYQLGSPAKRLELPELPTTRPGRR